MSLPSPDTAFPVLAKDGLAWVRIVGPGVCREIGRFENLLEELERRGFTGVVIDLTECSRLDSTFAGAFLRLAERAGTGPRFFLTGARGPVAELLEMLLVSDALPSLDIPERDREAFQDVAVEDRDRSREAILELSLDGHERLAELSDANARRFAALLEMLRAQVPAAAAATVPPAKPASGEQDE